MDDELLGRQSAFDEARALYETVLRGTESAKGLCELIAVPSTIERVLRALVKANSEDAWWVERSLDSAVLEEFNHLVRDSYEKIDAVPPLSLAPFTTPLDLPHLGQERSP